MKVGCHLSSRVKLARASVVSARRPRAGSRAQRQWSSCWNNCELRAAANHRRSVRGSDAYGCKWATGGYVAHHDYSKRFSGMDSSQFLSAGYSQPSSCWKCGIRGPRGCHGRSLRHSHCGFNGSFYRRELYWGDHWLQCICADRRIGKFPIFRPSILSKKERLGNRALVTARHYQA